MSPIPAGEQELNKISEKNSEVLYGQVVERIRTWIMKGYFKEGEALPSERELAQLFNVSRMPVSQALKILEFLGVVQQIRGKGVCVQQIDISRLLNNIGFLVLDPQSGLKDLLEAREAIEIQAVRLAARRRTEKDLDIMEDALLEMERNITLKKDVTNASIRFHSAIIAASGNDVISKINEFLMALLRFSRQKSLREASRQDIALQGHKQIFRAIKEKNEDTAVRVMMEHLLALSVES
ncbi:FadR/GntR family transcriptional regulator [Sporomusa acidovorans]|uniref:HTH-type transcriptional regulator LutR n=1 Tax=Sporomusa acidovorans (strain ATCC 49682 / DSM 3132 / Mol) TaxID=1123286 RepID=A0ABZ3J5X5_SPOA4|nr:FadR/GntR family transcriptional regulator [Sporomusa acidovorans]OZC24294.1 HTH-type transcriptional regulator LutR [Sporomusa acidovorans DSM 3132]SDF02779.1 transcriptional regulator, GntR family [Sporomusa acidovorans]